jgi:hypothetical protein
MCPEEPDLSTGTVVFALLLNKSAIGIYTTYEKAEEARDLFQKKQRPENKLYQIKPFKLDGPALIYLPY